MALVFWRVWPIAVFSIWASSWWCPAELCVNYLKATRGAL